MARSKRTPSLTRLFGQSPSPIYILDARRQVIYANAALCTWLGVSKEHLVGQTVAYHSREEPGSAAGIAAGLCPPPGAFAGERSRGYVSRIQEDGSLVYRRGEFLPLSRSADAISEPQDANQANAPDDHDTGCIGLVGVLDPRDTHAAELEDAADGEPGYQELHHAIGQLRQRRALFGSGAALVGESDAIRRARRQVELAALAPSPVLVVGSDPWQRRRVAAAIPHVRPETQRDAVVPFEGKLLDENLLSWSLDSLADRGRQAVTLLIHDLHELPMAAQEFLAERERRWPSHWRVIATCEPVVGDDKTLRGIDPRLFHWLSTLVVDLPPLGTRMEDLPLVVQYLVEEINAAGQRQVAGFSQVALDRMYLFDWPGGLEQLREVVAAAHAATKTPEIPPDALPAMFAHVEAAAAYPRDQAEPIVLEDLLAEIEIALIRRALELAEGNKTLAATLLGMTRPRLYRRMEQLGLADDRDPGT